MIFLSRVIVIGHSMEPTILPGQSVVVSGMPYFFHKPKVGDIILIKIKGKKNLLKRISQIKDSTYFVTGDNSKDSLDSNKFGWITKKQIFGKMVYKI